MAKLLAADTLFATIISDGHHLPPATVKTMVRAKSPGRTILITYRKGASLAPSGSWATLVLPDMPTLVAPLVCCLPLQLLAYHTALVLATDVDQPRNLAKSVTVE